jgi:RNA polymerase sigma factor (sigma-70 family)
MTDLSLLQRWRVNGDATAFREIVSRHAGLVYGTCRRILRDAWDAEDVAQECFEVLATRPGEPTVHVGAWLHRVATNRSISRIRSEQKRVQREQTFEAERDHMTTIETDELYRYVDQAIDALPEKYRAKREKSRAVTPRRA